MLTVNQLCKTFHQKTVADRISFSVPNGTITTILGASGSGKSTLLNMIAGLLNPDSGTISLNQRLLNPIAPEKRKIAMMFQDFALLPHLNVWQNVAFGLKMQGINNQNARQRAEIILNEVGLDNMAERQINKLSGGEQQRVALARALAVEPEVLLLDEPFSNLDSQLRGQLQQQIRLLIKKKNIATLLVSHDPNEACLMSDQIILLHQGCVLQAGKPETLLHRPVSAEAIQLLGGINIFAKQYIPPTAIKLNPLGETVKRLNSQILPLHIRSEIHHPRFGNLIFFHQQMLTDTNIQVSIDETQIVAFQ